MCSTCKWQRPCFWLVVSRNHFSSFFLLFFWVQSLPFSASNQTKGITRGMATWCMKLVLFQWQEKLTWHGFACMRFCSRASLVPPITTWTPSEGWYFNRVLASAAAWLASSRVGQITSTTIGGRFWSRLMGGDFTRISIDGSWNQELKKLVSSEALIRDNWYRGKVHPSPSFIAQGISAP